MTTETSKMDTWVNEVAGELAAQFKIECNVNRKLGKAHYIVCRTPTRSLLLHNITPAVMYIGKDIASSEMQNYITKWVAGEETPPINMFTSIFSKSIKYIIGLNNTDSNLPEHSINSICSKTMGAIANKPSALNHVFKGLEVYFQIHVVTEMSRNKRYHIHYFGRGETKKAVRGIAREQGMETPKSFPSEPNTKSWTYRVVKDICYQYKTDELSFLYTLMLVNTFGPPSHLIDKYLMSKKATGDSLASLVCDAKLGKLSSVS